jgi:DNA-binding protein YbaB
MQEQLVQAQSLLAETEVTGKAGEGAVAVTLSASGELSQLRLDPRVVDPAQVARLERLIMDAYGDAAQGVRELTERMMAPLSALVARAEQETD